MNQKLKIECELHAQRIEFVRAMQQPDQKKNRLSGPTARWQVLKRLEDWVEIDFYTETHANEEK